MISGSASVSIKLLNSLYVADWIVAIVDAVSGRKSSKVVHCMRVEIQIAVTATDMVSPKAFHASSCDAADSHPKPCGRDTSADATAISVAARFGGREHA